MTRSPAIILAVWLGALSVVSQMRAFDTLGRKWNTSTVTMHLQLGATSATLIDGSDSWAASAEDALTIWNRQISATQFVAVRDSTVPRGARNGFNNVYFSTTVNGEAWGSGVLAVTLSYSSRSTQTETDVLFNSQLNWNSYRGATRFSNGATLFDFHRVALHEFGHSLGLDHPDTAGQTVSALMNSRISSLDTLTSDDIAGAQSLYGAPASPISLPTITTQPTSRSVSPGQSTTFSVAATSSTMLRYQWLKNGDALAGATNASYTIPSVVATDAGNYAVTVSNSGGAVTSATAVLTLLGPPSGPAAVAPTIVNAPSSKTVAPGSTATFSVTVNGTAPLLYQWQKDGTALSGATTSVVTLTNVQSADAGNYTVSVSNSAGSVTSTPASLTVGSPTARSSRLVNLSTRAFIPAGGTLTPGFYIRGTGNKPLLIRAVGPTLRRFGIESALAETRLELLAQGSTTPLPRGTANQTIATDDSTSSVGAFPLDPNAKDDSVQANLAPQGYTVRVSPGDATMAGVSLAEIYDADPAASSARLVNVSTLGFVASGENVLTAGFVISGNAPKRLLIRAVGPGLTAFGVPGVLPDPQLAIMAQNGTEPLMINDDWTASDALRAAFENAGAFALQSGSRDAALVITLEPGAYTAIVSSVTANITGQALVEIYDLDP